MTEKMATKQKQSFDSFRKFFDKISEGKDCTLRGTGNFIYEYVAPDLSNNRSCNSDDTFEFSIKFTNDVAILTLNTKRDELPNVYTTDCDLFYVGTKNGVRCLFILGADSEEHAGARHYTLYLYDCKKVS